MEKNFTIIVINRSNDETIVKADFKNLQDCESYYNFLTDNGTYTTTRFEVSMWDNANEIRVK